MNISDIKFLYEYNDWTNQLILGKAAELTPEQFAQPNTFSFGSLRRTIIHTLDTEYGWRQLLQFHNLEAEDLLETDPFPTFDSIIAFWDNESAEWHAYLDSLSDADMENIVRYDTPEGPRARVLWHCLVHVVNHGTQHRSEAAQMLTDFGHSPGGLDITRYLNIRAGIE